MDDTRGRSAQEPADKPVKDNHRLTSDLLRLWAPILLFVGGLATWEFLVHTGGLSPLFFPAPSTIARTLFRLLVNGPLGANVGVTLSRVFLGIVLGGIPGLFLGLAMGWSVRLRAVLDPIVAAAHPVPKIAILPLIMIVFGIGESSKIVVVAVAAFFPTLINAMAGVRQISPTHFDVAKNYGASRRKVFTHVILPGSMPLVLTGVRLALNVALLLTIAVELVAAQEGLGAMIWFAWQTLRTEELFASLTVIAVLGIGFNLLLGQLTARLVPWHVEREI